MKITRLGFEHMNSESKPQKPTGVDGSEAYRPIIRVFFLPNEEFEIFNPIDKKRLNFEKIEFPYGTDIFSLTPCFQKQLPTKFFHIEQRRNGNSYFYIHR